MQQPLTREGATNPPGAPASGRVLNYLWVLAAINAAGFVGVMWQAVVDRRGLLLAGGGPFGGDFVNLWTTARLVLAGPIATIYDPDAFMAYQQDFLNEAIGSRLWAYPPHSLLLAWPFGLAGYFLSFVVWSLFGLFVLWLGARRFGFDWKECAVLLMSPAALCSIYYGQTGNLATGLLLVALAPRTKRDPRSVLAAALLTIKPQTGVLLPILWIVERRWFLVAATSIATVLVIGLSIAVFGLQPWRDYLGLTAPTLSELERFGSGVFMIMIPSLFMSLRNLGMDGDQALLVHGLFALVILAALVWRLLKATDARRRIVLVLIATVLATPYMHIYDLSILVVAALLLVRRGSAEQSRRIGVGPLVLFLWLCPYLVYGLGLMSFPITPALLTVVFFLV